MSAARCRANRAAGTIHFLTSYDYAAAASILDVLVAKQRDYFSRECLDVELNPGFSVDNVTALTAGRADVSSLGSLSEAMYYDDRGADLVALAAYGKTPIDALAVRTDSGVKTLRDLRGKTLAVKGAVPASLQELLRRGGAPLDSMHQVQVGFNPEVLATGRVDALPVYKSNEPEQLRQAGIHFRLFDPTREHIAGSFGVLVARRAFVKAHPSAARDLVRAALHGYGWAVAHPGPAVALSAARVTPNTGLSEQSEAFRWKTETALVRQSTPAGQGIGIIPRPLVDREVRLLDRAGLHTTASDRSKVFAFDLVPSLYRGTHLIWP